MMPAEYFFENKNVFGKIQDGDIFCEGNGYAETLTFTANFTFSFKHNEIKG